QRDQCGGRHSHGARSWPRPYHRHHPGRLRQPLSGQAVQSGILEIQGPAGAPLAGHAFADHRPALGMTALVSTEWLAAHLGEVRVVDASWYMPDDHREPKREFEAGHIPGAVFFDIDAISDPATDLPHMLPRAQDFARAVAALGIGNRDAVVVYDGAGIFSAPRVWWMFEAFGHPEVSVLDGGLPKWKSEGRALERGPASPGTAQFSPRPQAGLVRDFAQVKAALGHGQILDARSASRFSGAEAEPRPGLRSGHMPGAVNVPWRSLLTPENTL